MGERRKRIRPKLKMPYYPENGGSKAFFKNSSSDVKIVSDYTGYNFEEVYDLGIFDYWGYLHDAVVWNCGRSDAGKEYLENAYYYQQTEPDRKALRAKFGGGGTWQTK